MHPTFPYFQKVSSNGTAFNLSIGKLPGYIYWKYAESFTYQGCNQAWADLCGIKPADLIDKTDDDCPWDDTLRMQFLAEEEEVVSSGCHILSVHQIQYQSDPKDPVRDHNPHPEDIQLPLWLQFQRIPLIMEKKYTYGVVCVAVEVTHFKQHFDLVTRYFPPFAPKSFSF